MGNEVEELYNQGVTLLSRGAFNEAESFFSKILDLDDKSYTLVMDLLVVCRFWGKRKKVCESFNNFEEEAEYLDKQWDLYYNRFRAKIPNISPDVNDAVYSWLDNKRSQAYLAGIYREDGVGRKSHSANNRVGVGKYLREQNRIEEALAYFLEAEAIEPKRSDILAKIADCYGILGDDKKAKRFYRKAFLIDASAIDINKIEWAVLQDLIERVKKLGYSGVELKEWIPIYGEIDKVFNIKPPLTEEEFSLLYQSLRMLEVELKQTPTKITVPKLINHLFWAMDHYLIHGDKKASLDAMLYLKSLDEKIYMLYKNRGFKS